MAGAQMTPILDGESIYRPILEGLWRVFGGSRCVEQWSQMGSRFGLCHVSFLTYGTCQDVWKMSKGEISLTMVAPSCLPNIKNVIQRQQKADCSTNGKVCNHSPTSRNFQPKPMKAYHCLEVTLTKSILLDIG